MTGGGKIDGVVRDNLGQPKGLSYAFLFDLRS